MRNDLNVAVIIPVLNEEESIGKVLTALPKWVDDVIVVDNGSTDRSAEIASSHGARVIFEKHRGYGSACQAGITALNEPDIVVFLDGDFSDKPSEMALLIDPIANDETDFVIGSRLLGKREKGALTLQAYFGNLLACTLIRWFWNVPYTDLGPFRAIRTTALEPLNMVDRGYGWTVEMQIKAARLGLRLREIPVSYRKRIGKSKISGTIKGVLGAGIKIFYTIFLALISSIFQKEKMSSRNQLVIFTRYPEEGKTKTRLIPVLGTVGAADLQRQMTEHTLKQVRILATSDTASIKVCYEGGNTLLMKKWLGFDLKYIQQEHGELGERLSRIFSQSFQAGMERVIVIGTDCPGIKSQQIQSAFQLLDKKDLIIGPAKDGGYYLIGMHKPIPQLFEGIAWSTQAVLIQTMQIADQLGLSVELLDELADVDYPKDIKIWEQELHKPSISIIIPTLNEAESIVATLKSVQTARDVEIIVVDGGSSDNTVELARSNGAKVLFAQKGRAVQMNTGAEVAKGDILLFLHADTLLPKHYEKHIYQILNQSNNIAGAFEFHINGSSTWLRVIEQMVRWRSRYLQTPYGDQALFLRTDLFHKIGRFPNIAFMEDFELVRQLHQLGHIAIAPALALTSSRRWKTLGIWKTTFINQLALIAYSLGVAPSRIARWYYGN